MLYIYYIEYENIVNIIDIKFCFLIFLFDGNLMFLKDKVIFKIVNIVLKCVR